MEGMCGFRRTGDGACADCMWQRHPKQCSIGQDISSGLASFSESKSSPAKEREAAAEVSSDHRAEDTNRHASSFDREFALRLV